MKALIDTFIASHPRLFLEVMVTLCVVGVLFFFVILVRDKIFDSFDPFETKDIPKPSSNDFKINKHRAASEMLSLEGPPPEGPAHRVLGVSKDATEDEIQFAYRELVKKFHPDKLASQKVYSQEQLKRATEITNRINKARAELLALLRSKRS